MEEKYRRSLLDSVMDVVRDSNCIIFSLLIKKSPSPLVNQQGQGNGDYGSISTHVTP